MNKYSSEAIGKRLESGIADKGLTYKQFGDALSVTEDVVKNWTSGRTRIPIDKACKICDLFGWPMDRLAVRGEWDDQELMVEFIDKQPTSFNTETDKP